MVYIEKISTFFTCPFRTGVANDAYGVVNIDLSTHYVRQPISILHSHSELVLPVMRMGL